MAVIETEKQPRDVRAIFFVVALVIGFVALGAGVWWLVKPAAPRQVKLTGEQAKEAQASAAVTPTPALPAQPPIPLGTDPGPTLVSLDLKQVTPQQAIEELAKQAKVELRDDANRGGARQGFLASLLTQRVDVSVKNEPFWPTVLELCNNAGLMPYPDYQSPDRVTFTQAAANQKMGPVVAVGSSAIVLESVTSRFDASLTGPRPPARALNVSLKLFVEPKLKAYRISSLATLETAVDEKGNNLIRPRGQWDDRSGGGRQSSWMRDVECNLLFPENAGDTIRQLKGYASVAVAGPEKTEKIENPMAARNVDVKVDGVLVRFVELRKRGETMYEARMAGEVNSPVFRDYEKFNKVVSLVDRDGKEFQRSGGSWGGGRANTMDFSVMFTAPSSSNEPKELRITLPTQMREIRVPFDFKDLPLPH